MELTGIKFKRIKCTAMEGIVEEGNDLIEEIDKGPVRDVALIGAAQKVEHYENASYTTQVPVARSAGMQPSTARSTNTALHYWPLAEWMVDRIR